MVNSNVVFGQLHALLLVLLVTLPVGQLTVCLHAVGRLASLHVCSFALNTQVAYDVFTVQTNCAALSDSATHLCLQVTST